MYEKYLKLCDKALRECASDENKRKRLEIAKEMLLIPNSLLSMSINTALQIFVDLGYTKEQARAEYIIATELNK